MAYSTGILRERVQILNRTEAQVGKFGIDSSGIGFEPAGTVWAEVTWAKGKQAMNAGALDVYGIIMVRMRYNTIVSERSRIVHDGKTYQILGDTFHAQRQDNTIQFQAQQVVND
jgi:SPP1 family predicted phage head-tail adaptor